MSDTATAPTASAAVDPQTTATVDTYVDWLNETDADRRLPLLKGAWREDGHFLDPLLDSTGYDDLEQMVEAIHAQFPGHRFRRTTGIDGHHNLVRWGWELFAPDGAVVLDGSDVAIVGDDHRLQRVAGFFGGLPDL